MAKLAEAGDHVVAASALYGGTYNLLRHTLPKLGVTTTFVDDSDKPAPVDIETDPVSGDLFYVNINAGSIHRISYTG